MNIIRQVQVAVLAMLALLLAAIGGSDSVAAVHLCNICRHALIRSIRTMDCQSGRSWEQHSGDDPSIQQSSHAAVYTLLHNFMK